MIGSGGRKMSCQRPCPHETAHLDRRDAQQRLIVQLACSVQWFHPLAWLVSRSVMLSQEMAADRQAASEMRNDYKGESGEDCFAHGCGVASQRPRFNQTLVCETRHGVGLVVTSDQEDQNVVTTTEGSVLFSRTGFVNLPLSPHSSRRCAGICSGGATRECCSKRACSADCERAQSQCVRQCVGQAVFASPLGSLESHSRYNNGYGVIRIRHHPAAPHASVRKCDRGTIR